MAPVYATPADLAGWLGLPEPPAGAERALRDASLDVDALLVGAVYAVGGDGAPTSSRVADILMQATLHQVEHSSPELAGGQQQAMAPGLKAVKIDGISYTRATDPVTGRIIADRYSGRARDLLWVEGLIPNHPMVG